MARRKYLWIWRRSSRATQETCGESTRSRNRSSRRDIWSLCVGFVKWCRICSGTPVRSLSSSAIQTSSSKKLKINSSKKSITACWCWPFLSTRKTPPNSNSILLSKLMKRIWLKRILRKLDWQIILETHLKETETGPNKRAGSAVAFRWPQTNLSAASTSMSTTAPCVMELSWYRARWKFTKITSSLSARSTPRHFWARRICECPKARFKVLSESTCCCPWCWSSIQFTESCHLLPFWLTLTTSWCKRMRTKSPYEGQSHGNSCKCPRKHKRHGMNKRRQKRLPTKLLSWLTTARVPRITQATLSQNLKRNFSHKFPSTSIRQWSI